MDDNSHDYEIFLCYVRSLQDNTTMIDRSVLESDLLAHNIFKNRDTAVRCSDWLDRSATGLIEAEAVFKHAHSDGHPFRDELQRYMKCVISEVLMCAINECEITEYESDDDSRCSVIATTFEEYCDNLDGVGRYSRYPSKKYTKKSTSQHEITSQPTDFQKRRNALTRSALDRIIGRMITRIKENSQKRCQFLSDGAPFKQLTFEELSDVQKKKVVTYIHRINKN